MAVRSPDNDVPQHARGPFLFCGAVAFSPGGRLVASASGNNAVRL
jgi:hypothetical protein